ncbi:MAG: DUF927 domain-containing protein [Chromatiales bacterium]|nr:DUF927 domain-containing protein [Chromatiales bacterium]
MIPKAYSIGPNGVKLKPITKDDSPTPITYQPVWVDCRLRDPDRENWTIHLRWITTDGANKSLLIAQGQLHKSQTDLMSALSCGGLGIVDQKLFFQYLNESANHPHQRLEWGVTQLGYALAHLTNERVGLCYVWPDETQYARSYVDNAQVGAPTQLLPHTLNAIPTINAFHVKGTLKEWQQYIAEPTRGQVLHTFALLASLAAMLQPYAQVENAGFHFYGHSSRGKTIALQVACTVYGNGADPKLAASVVSLLQTWNITINALEPLARIFTGKVLTLDEMGMHVGLDSPVYTLVGGQGKNRMKSDGGLRERHQWNILILSSGEISSRHHIEKLTKRPLMAGEIIRLSDIPIDDLSSTAEAKVFEDLKQNCGHYYGAAGRAFIQSILDNVEGDEAALKEGIISGVNKIVTELKERLAQEGFVLQSHQQRALRTFALVLFCGRADLEDQNPILPIPPKRSTRRSCRCCRAWLNNQEFQSEEERAIQRLRDYYLRFRGRFVQYRGRQPQLPMPHDPQGIEDEGHLHLNEAQFEAACDGLDVQSVARALKQGGILHCNEKKRNTVQSPV